MAHAYLAHVAEQECELIVASRLVYLSVVGAIAAGAALILGGPQKATQIALPFIAPSVAPIIEAEATPARYQEVRDALQDHVLTDDEMIEALSYRSHIELHAFATQYRLRFAN